jgi:signal transduction histidine kinase/ActR/RegA family two-component response regulator
MRGAGSGDEAENLATARVPTELEPVFLKAQEYVREYFRDKVEDPARSTILISGERYLLIRAASLSVEFFDLVTSLYEDRGVEEATSVARNFLYDMAHSVGKADAKAFHARMELTDPIERLSAGPIHFAFAGWAFVHIFPESNPTPDDGYYLIYDHPFSFESDAWLKRGRSPSFPVCIMNAAYSSGWCAESFGLPLVAVEVDCKARGDDQCRFIMAPPSRIEGHLEAYTARRGAALRELRHSGESQTAVPEYFHRKRMEDELRASRDALEVRVRERTAELAKANEELTNQIAERRRAEQQRRELEAQILQSQKLESLGVLAGGIAHDFNNLLTPILGYTSRVLAEEEPESLTHRNVKQIRRAALRAAELTTQLLTYAGGTSSVTTAIDLSALAREMASLLETATSRKAELSYALSENLPAIEADPVQIRQVLMNLVSNASDSIGDRPGAITVRTGVMEADRGYLSRTYLGTDAPAGSYVFLEVSDSGCGMSEEMQEKIFDPFFTTKRTGRGLGLAALLGIVRTHGGALRVESAPGVGSSFRVLLPSSGAAAQEDHESGAATDAWQASGTVLVVDDDDDVREVIRWMTESAGFSVITAVDGRQGVELFRERKDEIRAVLLDLTMPQMGGEEAFREIRRIRPDARIVLSSGYSAKSVARRLAGENFTAFIQKPYEEDQLVQKLREVLED